METRLKEEMSPFFMAVAELAENRGFEVDGVKGGVLNLNLNAVRLVHGAFQTEFVSGFRTGADTVF